MRHCISNYMFQVAARTLSLCYMIHPSIRILATNQIMLLGPEPKIMVNFGRAIAPYPILPARKIIFNDDRMVAWRKPWRHKGSGRYMGAQTLPLNESLE